jgi:hypothetical protein
MYPCGKGVQPNLAKIPVTFMAGQADLMQIHQTAIWRVRHKRPFLVRPTHPGNDPLLRQRASLAKLHVRIH